jgi:hypothetical protein
MKSYDIGRAKGYYNDDLDYDAHKIKEASELLIKDLSSFVRDGSKEAIQDVEDKIKNLNNAFSKFKTQAPSKQETTLVDVSAALYFEECYRLIQDNLTSLENIIGKVISDEALKMGKESRNLLILLPVDFPVDSPDVVRLLQQKLMRDNSGQLGKYLPALRYCAQHQENDLFENFTKLLGSKFNSSQFNSSPQGVSQVQEFCNFAKELYESIKADFDEGALEKATNNLGLLENFYQAFKDSSLKEEYIEMARKLCELAVKDLQGFKAEKLNKVPAKIDFIENAYCELKDELFPPSYSKFYKYEGVKSDILTVEIIGPDSSAFNALALERFPFGQQYLGKTDHALVIGHPFVGYKNVKGIDDLISGKIKEHGIKELNVLISTYGSDPDSVYKLSLTFGEGTESQILTKQLADLSQRVNKTNIASTACYGKNLLPKNYADFSFKNTTFCFLSDKDSSIFGDFMVSVQPGLGDRIAEIAKNGDYSFIQKFMLVYAICVSVRSHCPDLIYINDSQKEEYRYTTPKEIDKLFQNPFFDCIKQFRGIDDDSEIEAIKKEIEDKRSNFQDDKGDSSLSKQALSIVLTHNVINGYKAWLSQYDLPKELEAQEQVLIPDLVNGGEVIFWWYE